MDNSSTWDPFLTEGVRGIDQNSPEMSNTISPYLNITNPSSWAIYNSTHTNYPNAGSVEDESSLATLWMYLATRILWSVLAIFGNSLTIFAVTKFERLQTCTNYLICSLAVSDLLSGLMVPLIMVHELHRDSTFFINVCLPQQTLACISISGNNWSILYLSIDRYLYIAFPLRYQDLVTPWRVFILLTLTWTTNLISSPTLVFTENHLKVGMPCRLEALLNEWVTAIFFAPQICLIFVLTIGFNLAIARIAHKQARQIQAEQQPYNTLAMAISQSTKKISRTLGLVLGVYVLSIMPQLIVACINFSNKPIEAIEKLTVTLYWVNSCVNPLIYAWRLKDFRIAFKKIFTGTGSFNEVPGINV